MVGYQPYRPKPFTPPQRATGTGINPVNLQGLRTNYAIPGVNSRGLRGGTPNVQAAAFAQTVNRSDPLQAYQAKLKDKIDQGERFNQQLSMLRQRPQTKTGFEKKYGTPNKTMSTRLLQPDQRKAQLGPYRAGVSVGGRTGMLDPRSLSRSVNGALLIAPATAKFNALNAAFRQQFGRNIAVTDSYRSYAQQVATKRSKGRLAATPGKSVHGLGKAVDLGGGINKRGSREWQWMMQNAPKFGWVNPKWAQTTKIEPWHWEFVG